MSKTEADGYNGYIPTCAIKALERAAAGLIHGMATLEFHVRDGSLARFCVHREESFVPGDKEGAAE